MSDGVIGVSTHSRLKAAGDSPIAARLLLIVSTHSRLKAAGDTVQRFAANEKVSTHSRLKAAGCLPFSPQKIKNVSTHSRLKAAGILSANALILRDGFNTQPPEGGWVSLLESLLSSVGFQHTAA